jgi:hypothetical protein
MRRKRRGQSKFCLSTQITLDITQRKLSKSVSGSLQSVLCFIIIWLLTKNASHARFEKSIVIIIFMRVIQFLGRKRLPLHGDCYNTVRFNTKNIKCIYFYSRAKNALRIVSACRPTELGSDSDCRFVVCG